MKSNPETNLMANNEIGGPVMKRKIEIDVRAFTMIGALLVIWIIFGFLTQGTYLSSRNMSLLIRQMTITSILTTGVVLLIVGSFIDLSLGSIVGLTGGVSAILQINYNWSPVTAILVALAIGVLIGVWHGFWVAMHNVPAFIVTLGGLMIFRGILLGITRGRTISPFPQSYKVIGQGYIAPEIGILLAILVSIVFVVVQLLERNQRIKYGFAVDSSLKFWAKMLFGCVLVIGITLFLNQYQGIPVPVVILIVLVAILTFVANKTKFGRHVYAMGGNMDAAKLSGINTKKVTMLLFMLCGFFASIAGIVLTARLDAAPTSAGTGAELDAIAAAVIGGTSLSGGVGSIPGAIIGALVMASLDNGMSLMNVDVFVQQIIKGLILTLAVWFDVRTKK